MREFLFRGKRLADGKWIYGYYFEQDMADGMRSYIRTLQADRFGTDFAVDPATVGQYTGVVDRNGKRVFEGDIIGYTDTDTGKTEIFGVVKWYHEGNFYINTDTYCNYTSDSNCANVGYMLNRATTKLIVIGNIHDNPEPLKGGEK